VNYVKDVKHRAVNRFQMLKKMLLTLFVIFYFLG